MPSRTERGQPRATVVLVVLALAYLAMALHDLGAADIIGDDEAREVGIVQSMLAGHWLLPLFNDELLPDKPLLYHWLAALPAAVGGFSELAVRLPAALCGTATIVTTAWTGRLLFGPRKGLVGAGLLATTPGLFTHARVARPDTLLVAILTLAFALGFRWWRNGARRDAVAVAALLGVSVLAKGPVGPALFAAGFGTFLLWQGSLRRLPGLVTLPGVVLFLAFGLGWYAVALSGWGERFVAEHLVGRYLRNLAGGLVTGHAYSPKPWRYHLLFYPQHLPAVLLPWTPFVAVALWQAFRSGGLRDPATRFLLCWACAPIAVFTPAEWKLRYYLLPALPPSMLLAAPLVAELLDRAAGDRGPTRTRRIAALVVGLAILAAGVVALLRPEHLAESDRATLDALASLLPGEGPALATLVGIAAGLLVGAVLRWSWPALVAAVAAGSIGWMTLGVPALEQAMARTASMKPLARAIVQHYPESTPLVFAGPTIRPLVVYAERTIPSQPPGAPLAPAVAVIAPDAVYAPLARQGRVGPPVLTGEGRIANLARTRVVVADVLPP